MSRKKPAPSPKPEPAKPSQTAFPAAKESSVGMTVGDVVAATQWITRNLADIRNEEYTFAEMLKQAQAHVNITTAEAFQAVLDASDARPKWKPDPPPTAKEFATAVEAIRRGQEEVLQLRKTVAELLAKVGETAKQQALDEAEKNDLRRDVATNAKGIAALQKDAAVLAKGLQEAIGTGQRAERAADANGRDILELGNRLTDQAGRVDLNARDIAGIDARLAAQERRAERERGEGDPADRNPPATKPSPTGGAKP